MKKTLFMLMGMFLLLELTGCSKPAKTTNSTHIQSTQKEVVVKNYQYLSNENRRKVNFHFTATLKNSGYTIMTKITNNTKHSIKINQAKFDLQLPDNEISTKQSGILVIKPKQTKTIQNLFQKLTVNELGQTDTFITYAHDIKLSATRSMLPAETLNTSEQSTSSNDESNNNEDQNPKSDSQIPVENQATSPTNPPAQTKLTEAQARQFFADSGYGDTSKSTAERRDDGWYFDGGQVVYDNGYVLYPGNYALNHYMKEYPDTDTDDSYSDDTE
ncbi:hypothetical protein [Companilactobacillus nantensis]|uniref:Uncharacterized protein n=1 Tax=Companilactobacillus nantensis DSM 16982 TaxID=1423774 RepID=A0A0R1WFH4_9LACO|nr:hypothetical protein [Companilactobacillus nantensis]KRM16545.1 hypothetical protein FD31_GL000553 [Companilactobacillus nantensis DSM 16982]GEO64513.1 hypothetical protein LNA01_16960 [Companilactobacillus nantensis]